MTRKHMVGVFVGGLFVILLGTVVYMQFTRDTRWQSQRDSTRPVNRMTQSDVTKQEAVPESIDGITESIFVESSADTSALEAEGAEEAALLDEDNESVNNLENSYDENNL